MTAIRHDSVACEACGRSGRFAFYDSVNVTQAPQLRDAVLRRDLFRHRCGCGHETLVIYPFMYHDMTRRFMVWLLATDQHGRPRVEELPPTRSPGYRLRAVGGLNQVIERIQIFESDLNDAVIEMVKLAVVRSGAPPGALFFAERLVEKGKEVDAFLHVSRAGERRLFIPTAVYASMRDLWDKIGGDAWIADGYQVVDATLADRALARKR